MDVMTLGNYGHNIQVRNRRPIAGFGQAPKPVLGGTAVIGILAVAAIGAFIWFTVAATGERYTLRGLGKKGRGKKRRKRWSRALGLVAGVYNRETGRLLGEVSIPQYNKQELADFMRRNDALDDDETWAIFDSDKAPKSLRFDPDTGEAYARP
ncbi:MAG: hypothetical protein GY769_20250 [bacterium]|nr:hypothetical protein [bacterium]